MKTQETVTCQVIMLGLSSPEGLLTHGPEVGNGHSSYPRKLKRYITGGFCHINLRTVKIFIITNLQFIAAIPTLKCRKMVVSIANLGKYRKFFLKNP